MKKYFSRNKLPFERIFLIAISFILQIIWFVGLYRAALDYSVWLGTAMNIFSVIMILYLVIKDESPAYRMSWIILIVLFPVFGGFLYLLIGNKKPTRKMEKRIRAQEESYHNVIGHQFDAMERLKERHPRLGGLAQYIDSQGRMPVYTGTKAHYYPNGESMMDDLIADIEAAEHHIFIEFFIVEYGEMFDRIISALKEKASQGLDVRFIYDDFGSITRLPKSFDEELEAMGIKALKFNPVKPIISMVYNTRDHRKSVIIDEKIGYSGGLNIADEYINKKERFGYWKDIMIRIQGPAVWNLTVLFLNMWNSFYKTNDQAYEAFLPEEMKGADTDWDQYQLASLTDEYGFVQPFGDSPLDHEPLGESVYRDILNVAEDYVYIYTPYLVISYELQTAITLASKRGVDVRIMTPGIPDKRIVYRMTRSFYPPLLKAGVRIFEYSPGFLHAKMFVCDDKVATVGTINLDYRSLYLHFEMSTMLYYVPEIADIETDFLQCQAQSREIKLSDTKQGFWGKLWDAILRLMAPFV